MLFVDALIAAKPFVVSVNVACFASTFDDSMFDNVGNAETEVLIADNPFVEFNNNASPVVSSKIPFAILEIASLNILTESSFAITLDVSISDKLAHVVFKLGQSNNEDLDKEVLGIESSQEHFATMDSLSLDEQLIMLRAVLKKTEKEIKRYERKKAHHDT